MPRDDREVERLNRLHSPTRLDRGAPLRVYRLGAVHAPLAFTPWDLCSWGHRWDDPLREYRTLYCAVNAKTCLREALAPLRPSAKTIAELHSLGAEIEPVVLAERWFDAHVMAEATILSNAELVDIEAPSVRESIARDFSRLLRDHGVSHLDITELRGRSRSLTQAVGRIAWEQGAAGIRYRSNLDDGECYALFEARAGLVATGHVQHFTPWLMALLDLGIRVRYEGWSDRYARARD